MSVKIPKSFINELLYRTNIVELIDVRIKLKKKGKNYQTHCPFHQDKTPSFTVSYEKQFYYCFGCNAHGNAIDFLINYDRLSFLESIEEMAIYHGIPMPFQNINNQEYTNKQKIYVLMENMSKFYQKNIISAQNASLYLKKRGINQDMVDMFSIGFASLEWNYFSKKLNLKKEYQQDLIKFQIIKTDNNGNTYDHFRGRIIFPIHNKNGKVIGFGGRALYDVMPKYLNSPENHIFHKGKEIYGLYQVKKKNIKPKYLLIVEGYIDVIMLTQYNIDYVVSSLGTSTTKEQIQLLFRNTNTIIYCYDGDEAGKEASWRALKIALPYISDIKTLKFILLPKNEDPDTIIRKEGKKNFQKRIDNALTLSIFFFKMILKNINLSSTDGKFYLSQNALPLINMISNDIIRLYFRQILARKIGILDDNQFEKFLYEKSKQKNKKNIFHIKRTPMRTLIGLLIQNPKLAKIAPPINYFKNINIKGLPIFLEILKTCNNDPNLNTGQLIELYRENKIINIIKILARWDHMIVPDERKNMFLDLLKNIYDKILESRQENLISKDRTEGITMDEKKEIWRINQELSKKNK